MPKKQTQLKEASKAATTRKKSKAKNRSRKKTAIEHTPRRDKPAPRIQSVAPIRHLYPYDAYYLDMNGPWMHYLDEGEGPPIIMLHGNPTWSFYYRALINGLKDQHRIIVPDHIGCGLSEKPRIYPYTLSTHIDNLSRLIDHLKLQEVTLAVHDWGGAIGFGWAMRNPERVKRLIVFNSAAFVGGPIPFRIRACRWPVLGDLAVRGLNAFIWASFLMGTGHRERFTKDVRKGYLLPYNDFASRIAIQRFVRDIPAEPTDASYTELVKIESSLDQFRDHPMAIFWGMQDFCFSEHFLNGWIDRFPNAEVHRYADAGHYVVEDAHERILPAMQEFIANHP